MTTAAATAPRKATVIAGFTLVHGTRVNVLDSSDPNVWVVCALVGGRTGFIGGIPVENLRLDA